MKRIRDRSKPFFVCRHCSAHFKPLPGCAAKFCSIDCALWSRVQKGSPDECWPWKAAKVGGGYGHFQFAGLKRANRVAYEITHGPLAPGLCACHRCDNPSCCNPSHIFAGTHAENMRDMRDKGRAVFTSAGRRGEECYRATVTSEQVRQIRDLYANSRGRRTAKIARLFGVSRGCCSAIIHRRTWKHI